MTWIWVFPKIMVPQNGWWKFHGSKPYEQIRMIWGGKLPPLFLVQHPYIHFSAGKPLLNRQDVVKAPILDEATGEERQPNEVLKSL